MALGDSYASVQLLAKYLEIDEDRVPDVTDKLTACLSAASREVEGYTGRQFNKTEVASTREYEPVSKALILTDDFWTTDELVIKTMFLFGSYGTAWPPQDYRLLPMNGVVDGVPGFPFRRIRLERYSTGLYSDERVQVTAKWGWEAVPAPVVQSTLILGARNYKLAKAVLGVAGFSESGGQIRVRDVPQVCQMLHPYVVNSVMVG